MKLKYSQEFREQALQKLLQRGDKTIECKANELNINVFTLKHWLRRCKRIGGCFALTCFSTSDRTGKISLTVGLSSDVIRKLFFYAHLRVIQFRKNSLQSYSCQLRLKRV